MALGRKTPRNLEISRCWVHQKRHTWDTGTRLEQAAVDFGCVDQEAGKTERDQGAVYGLGDGRLVHAQQGDHGASLVQQGPGAQRLKVQVAFWCVRPQRDGLPTGEGALDQVEI